MLVLPIFIIAFILQLFLPWWIIGFVSFSIAAWQARSGTDAFRGGFIAIFLLWLTVSLWKSLPNQNILANRIGEMFMLPAGAFNWILMVSVTSFLGGLASGIAALSGFYCRQVLIKKRTEKQ